MDKRLLKAIVKEHEKRKQKIDVASVLLESLFNKQLDFINDPAQFKTASCTRRAGKTYCAAVYLIYTCLKYEGVNCVYIALSRATAKRLIWPQIVKFNRLFGLNIQANLQELSFTFENSSTIYLVGANDEATCENLRGDKYKVVILDEAASYRRHIDNLIDAIITPALLDLRGTLCLIGTPGPILDGAFYKACHGKKPYGEYSNHTWSLLDNPHLEQDPVEWLETYKRQKGISEDNPIFQREYRGKWVKAEDHFVYKLKEKNVLEPENPKECWDVNYIIGVDLGYDDATAISVIGYRNYSPVCRVVTTFKKTNMNVSQVAEEVRRYYELYNPVSIVADSGGLGKSIVEEMRQRYSIPIKAAEKHQKYEYIELMNSDLHENKLIINNTETELIEEMLTLQWDETKRAISDRYEDHLCDATLYAWRESKHFAYEKEVETIKVNTPAYWKAFDDIMLTKLIEQQKEQNDWEQELWN